MDIILIYFAIKYKGDWNKIYEALDQKEKPDLKAIQDLEKKLKATNIKVITIVDKDYPSELKKAYKPPFVLWFQGDLNRLNNKTLCITGNKTNVITNQRIQQNINHLTMQHEVILPGFSGVDQTIELVCKRSLIRILARGIDFAQTSSDLLVSEFPPEIKEPQKAFFKQRNRIIAALSEQLVLFSSNANGGMNHLVNSFLNLGKEVSCFPGDGNANDGNSELIKQGANLITSLSEVC